ncbi:hypothetical protein GCM10009547_34930 [Sporichthya brevicatena]|uniref:DUF2637 domain-containing protein n=1 Tax=Sporichthya brevicatena TaxID=171442 RepID=A0ABP3S7I8_9ACTN
MIRLLRRVAPPAAIVVGFSAAIATSHGVFEVVRACGVPAGMAALYPVITDGLALVGYACAVRISTGHRRWAWTVVIVAAGLSGIAQAAFLGGGLEQPPAWLRFGVGAWPAIAAALTAHLLFLMATSNPNDAVQSSSTRVGQRVQAPSSRVNDHVHDALNAHLSQGGHPAAVGPLLPSSAPAPAKERALAVAGELCGHRDALPTVSELAAAAGVARGTAATALRELRSRAGGAARGGESTEGAIQ